MAATMGNPAKIVKGKCDIRVAPAPNPPRRLVGKGAKEPGVARAS